MEKAMEFARSL